ncbi:hypothetical protein PHMEG_0003226 [Phytophthora megakarya]|uniref:Uncharacterized protein n=1 Tax=Phytophthora megakarya TaxID=4795 RepID=A0A225WWU7_9STRA|nr:hypothetical protein PHMEG_0003226 [Phytophthora megakarya]
MSGSKLGIYHIRTFGSLAYVHVPVTPGRRKYHDNVKLGFVLDYDELDYDELDYDEDAVGCEVYFPGERTAKFVRDLRVSEDVMYRDSHTVDLNEPALESLVFTRTYVNVICGTSADKAMDTAITEISGVETESVVGVHGSVLGEQEDTEIYNEAAEIHSVQDDSCSGNDQDQDFNTEADDTVTVASVFAHASERNWSVMKVMVTECDGDLSENKSQ